MPKLDMPITQRHKFVGDVTTISFCLDNQFAGRAKTIRGAHVTVGSNVWSRLLVWPAGQRG